MFTHYYVIIPLIAAFLCATSGLVYWTSLISSTRLLVLESVLSIATDTLSFYNREYSAEIHNAFILVDALALLLASISILKIRHSAALVSGAIMVSIAGLTYSIASNGFSELANFAFAIVSLLVTITYGICLYTNEMASNNNSRVPVRLICAALLIYHCGTFAIFCAIHFVMSNRSYSYIVDINTTLDSLKYLLIAIAFYLFKKKSVSRAATT